MNSKLIFSLASFVFASTVVYGQKIDTTFFDSNWKATTKDKSSFYRIAKKVEEGKAYTVEDYFNSGRIQMSGVFSSLKPEVKNGVFVWYYENGNKKTESIYENNQIKSIKRWKEDGEIDTNVYLEKPPVFRGGIEKMYAYISKHFKYPRELKQRINGKIVLSFVVEKDGSIVEATIKESVHPLLDAEGVRVLKSMPKWEPGMQEGKPVRVMYTVPILINFN